MMHRFCRGRIPERFGKGLVLDEELLQQLLQIWVPDAVYQFQQLQVHGVIVLPADRQIIRRIVLPLLADPDALDRHLQSPLEIVHIPVDLYVVQRIIIPDPRIVRLPDLGVHSPCLVLQYHVLVRLSVLRHCSLLMLAEIDIGNPIPFLQVPDEFHLSDSS